MEKLLPILIGFLILSSCKVVHQVNLDQNGILLVDRGFLPSNTKGEINIESKEGAALAIINNEEFESGIIELQIKGENKPGQSFVGFAFNVQDENTYEAIYFRPFNFLAPEKIRREHGIQYIHPPNHEWRSLRENHPGVYEAEFPAPPNPEQWFKFKLKISPTIVEVYDSRNGELLLAVERLSVQRSKTIALWIGHNSKGSYRNLHLKKE